MEGEGKDRAPQATISFFEKDAVDVHPYNDDPWSLMSDAMNEILKEFS